MQADLDENKMPKNRPQRRKENQRRRTHNNRNILDAPGRVGVKPCRRGTSPSRVGPLGRDRMNARGTSTAMDGERPGAIALPRAKRMDRRPGPDRQQTKRWRRWPHHCANRRETKMMPSPLGLWNRFHLIGIRGGLKDRLGSSRRPAALFLPADFGRGECVLYFRKLPLFFGQQEYTREPPNMINP